MTTGFVTSCYIESFFGVLKDAHIATGKSRITNVTGVGVGIKSGTFITQEERLRLEQKRRKKSHLPARSKEECAAFANEDSLVGWHSLDEETKEYLYTASRGRWKTVVAEVTLSLTHRLDTKNNYENQIYIGMLT
jgi:hypothetical protein